MRSLRSVMLTVRAALLATSCPCGGRAHAGQYGYDPAKIAALADSAGGQLVSLLGTSAGVAALEGAQLGNPGVSSSVKAAIVLYPDVNFLSGATWPSEMTYLTPGRQLPEFLITQGTQDCIVPYQGAVEFYDALIKTGGSSAAQLIMERGEGHYPDFNYTQLESPIIKLLRGTIGPEV
jgi:acetyl esterase/lipase